MNSLKKIAFLLMLAFVFSVSGCVTVQENPSPADQWQTPIAEVPSEGLSAVEKLINTGKSQRQKGDYAAAAGSLERALRLAPRSPEAYIELSQVKLAQQAYQKAIQLAEKALIFVPKNQLPSNRYMRRQAWSIVAKSRYSLGDLAGAKEAESKASEG